jgi:hypothetical protein
MGKLKKVAPYVVGQAYFIRGITFHYLGRIVAITAGELVLDEASWVADTLVRLNTFLGSGVAPNSEIEPFPGPVTVNRAAVVDATPWLHPLPRVAQ